MGEFQLVLHVKLRDAGHREPRRGPAPHTHCSSVALFLAAVCML
jgi:hypothetical protein